MESYPSVAAWPRCSTSAAADAAPAPRSPSPPQPLRRCRCRCRRAAPYVRRSSTAAAVMAQQLACSAVRAAAPHGAAACASAAPPPRDRRKNEDEPPAGPVTYDVKKAFGAIARIHTARRRAHRRSSARASTRSSRATPRAPRSRRPTPPSTAPHMADPRVVNGFRPLTKEMIYQIVIERSRGSRMWDLDGNEYVDVLSGFGMSLFGWQPDFVREAIHEQLDARLRDRPAAPARRRGRASCSASSPAPSAPRSATPAPRR